MTAPHNAPNGGNTKSTDYDPCFFCALYAPWAQKMTKWNKIGTKWEMLSDAAPHLCIKQTNMHDWIILLVLGVMAISLASAGIVVCCCRRMKREKNRAIVHALHEQDCLARELERARIAKQTLERLARTNPAEIPGDGKMPLPSQSHPTDTNPQGHACKR